MQTEVVILTLRLCTGVHSSAFPMREIPGLA